jgi:hypothetical protein
MSRASALPVRDDLESVASPHALLAFLTLTHPRLAEPIRVVSDVFDYIWAGETYIGLPFGFQILSDNEGPPSTQIRIQNVDRRIGQALRTVPDRATVRVDVLSSADFDLSVDPRTEVGTPAAIYAFRHFELVDVEVNAVEITGRVFLRDYAQEPWGRSATQSRCPGLFR